MIHSLRFSLLSLALAVGALPALAQTAAPEPAKTHRLQWDPEWRRFGWVDAIQTGATTAAFLYLNFGVDEPEPNWTGPILFDEATRDALAARSRKGRDRAATISDIFWYTPMVYPFLDSLVTPLATDDWNWDIAWQLEAMNLQSLSVNALFTRFGHRVIARARPDTEACEADPDYDADCGRGITESFWSGHTSSAFMGASLTCIHHSQLPLYGGGAPDAAVCIASAAMAVTNGISRIVTDRHYVSDVLAGAIGGTAIGLVMPLTLHYYSFGSFSSGHAAAAFRMTVLPMASEDTVGLGAHGWF